MSDQDVIIELTPLAAVEVDITQTAVSVDVTSSAPQGPPGPQGVQGVQGPQGRPGAGGSTYVHQQLTPSPVWTIVHGLGGFPAVATIDSGGTEVFGDVTWPDVNTVTVTFGFSQGGTAYLNI